MPILKIRMGGFDKNMEYKKFFLLSACIWFGLIQVTEKANAFTQTDFNRWAKENKIIGAALAVDDKKYFYGFSDKGLTVDDKTQFGIGSITKTFVSVILLKLEAENKLNIQDPIVKYLPQYSKLKKLLKQYQNGQVKTSNYDNAYAAGGLVSNIDDLKSFINHLFISKDLLPPKQYAELTTFVKTSEKYYAFTGMRAPQFGLGVFKWNIPPYGDLLNYSGVLAEGFTSAYIVIGNHVIIAQSNTYNDNNFTILWPNGALAKTLINTGR